MIMQVEPIAFKHQRLLDQRFENLDFGLSEYSFANAFLFKEKHSFEVITGQSVYLRGVHVDNARYIMVTEPFDKIPLEELREVMQTADYLFPVPANWQEKFPFEIKSSNYSEGDSDYIFSKDKFKDYAGQRLGSKRHQLHQFLDEYSYEAHPLTKEWIPAAREILQQWHDALGSPDAKDELACQKAFEYLETPVRIEGRIYVVEGKPAGFVIGGPLTQSMYILHFVKGLKEYKGIYQFLYSEFTQNIGDNYRWINMEQDLGEPQLAQAKRSYDPDYFGIKWKITPALG